MESKENIIPFMSGSQGFPTVYIVNNYGQLVACTNTNINNNKKIISNDK